MGQLAVSSHLEDRMAALAIRIMDSCDNVGTDSPVVKDWALELAGLALECEEHYVRLETTGEPPTVAQGVALAQFLRGRIQSGDARVTQGGLGLPGSNYLHVVFADGYEGGIAPDGSIST